MKILKRLICFLLVLPIAFSLVACGKNKSKDNDNNGDDSSSAEVEVLTTSQILQLAYNKFDEESKNDVLLTNSYSEKNGNDYIYPTYGNYVYGAMKILDEISKISDLKEEVWCLSDGFDANNSKVNKLSKFKLSKISKNNMTTITLHIKFDIKGFNPETNLETFDMLHYVIKYSELTRGVSVEGMIEKSRNNTYYDLTDSSADCFVFNYTPGDILAFSFTRNCEIDNINNLNQINNSSISNIHYFKFNLNENNVIIEFSGFNDPNYFDYNEVQELVQTYILNLKNINTSIDEGVLSENKLENLSDELIELVNNLKVVVD